MTNKLKTALSIAGSDSSGGAGIQADLKTFLANGVYGMSVTTAITAQNTMGITNTQVLDSKILEDQLRAVFDDIYPDAIKIGMLGNEETIRTIVKILKEYEAKNIVLDPVMVSTSGSRLFDKGAMDILVNELFPLTSLITPNMAEAGLLLGKEISSQSDMEDAAKSLYKKHSCPTLVKGGHLQGPALDILVDQDGLSYFKGQKINNPNVHGTGCTLSSAIASNLAKGKDLKISIKEAKTYVSGTIKKGLDLGQGPGPLNHGYLFL